MIDKLTNNDFFLSNHWGDKYWGICDGEGENRFGEILMKIRSEIA